MDKVKLYKNIKLGKNVVVEQGAIIGLPPHGTKDGQLKTVIGDNAYIRTYTIIYAGVKIGKNFQTGPHVLIREKNYIGDDVVIWHGTTLNPDNKIGSGTRIHAGCFLEMVSLGKNVFVGPEVVFTNDPHPIIPIQYRQCWGGATVKEGAVIGANVTILPHVVIGKKTVIGAGSVVTTDIADNKLALGNPAKITKEVSDITCKRGGKIHKPYSTR